jgi:hypothetical protein
MLGYRKPYKGQGKPSGLCPTQRRPCSPPMPCAPPGGPQPSRPSPPAPSRRALLPSAQRRALAVHEQQAGPARARAPHGAVVPARGCPLLMPRHRTPPALPSTLYPPCRACSATATQQERCHHKQKPIIDEQNSRRIFLSKIRSPRCVPAVSKVWNRIHSSSSFICPASRNLPCLKLTAI